MSGLFGVVSREDCISSLYYGTDYHCHLGTRRGGLAVRSEDGFTRTIHDITNAQFKSKFDDDIRRMRGRMGLGIISDYEDQPLIIGSHLGTYAIATVGVIKNADMLSQQAFGKRTTHFSEMSGNQINPTELVATIINQEESFVAGIQRAQELIEGSCTLVVMTQECLYAARDKLGRTPIVLGKSENSLALASESCAFYNLGFEPMRDLGPGEIIRVTADGVDVQSPPRDLMQICSFLWIYYGYPASEYEGINVEHSRYRCGAALAKRDTVKPDLVAGIPDSGIAHALGYAQKAQVPYGRPFVKYTPTWPRSFMPQSQEIRDLVARMKLLPISKLTEGKKLLFCDDSVVRGTQLRDSLQRLYAYGAKEIHLRPACPPLVFGCKFLNFSRSRSELDLAARKAILKLEGRTDGHLDEYVDESSDRYAKMVDIIRQSMGLDTLQYQKLDDMVEAIGLPREKLCTYCWNGCENKGKCGNAA
jgi:amidophosphoribosyltransferase